MSCIEVRTKIKDYTLFSMRLRLFCPWTFIVKVFSKVSDSLMKIQAKIKKNNTDPTQVLSVWEFQCQADTHTDINVKLETPLFLHRGFKTSVHFSKIISSSFHTLDAYCIQTFYKQAQMFWSKLRLNYFRG